MKKEIWKDIPGYEETYQVSNLGRVKSLDRYVKSRYGFRKQNGLILSQRYDTSRSVAYLKVNLYKDVRKTIKVHQLVAMAFLGHIRTGNNTGVIIDHIDGDSLNNNLNNLQLITQKENVNKGKRIIRSFHKDYGLCKTYNDKWKIVIKVNKKAKYFGTFESLSEARIARDKAIKKEGLR